ncbi:PrgI family protein [Candidatus Kaiserbacteria bacterium]|nr:PrgI family protein [Candidatus Kaiserbacteria bacterium]
MEFQVPQFIEVEDRIFGPLTLVQFIYLTGGVGFAFAMWLLLPLWAAILLGAPVALLGAGLAFWKVNERPLIATLQSAFEYAFHSKLYIWEKKKNVIPAAADIALLANNPEDPAKYVTAATANRIKDLSWSLDVREHAFAEPVKKGAVFGKQS